MVFGILMTVLGLGTICALLYYCSVFALPVFVGLSAAFLAMNSGAGSGSVLIGFACGVGVFVAGKVAFSNTRSLVLRWLVGLLFAVPAALAGYSLVLQLSEFGVPSFVWRHAFAIIGGALTGFAVFTQLGKSSEEIASG